MKSNRSIHVALAIGALATAPALVAAQTGGTSPSQQGAQQSGHPGTRSDRRAEQQQQQKGQQKEPMRLQEHVSFPVEDGCRYTASVTGKIAQAGGGAQQPQRGQSGGSQRGASGQEPTGGLGHGQEAGGSQAQAGGAAGQRQGQQPSDAAGQRQGQQPSGGEGQRHAQQPSGAEGQRQAQQGPGASEKLSPNLNVSASISCPNTAEIRISETLKPDKPVSRAELEDMISRRASIATKKNGRFCMYVPEFELTREKLNSRGVTQLCRVSPEPRQDQQKHGMR